MGWKCNEFHIFSLHFSGKIRLDFLLPKFLAGQGPNSSRKLRWNKTHTHFLCRSTMTNSRHHALYFPHKNKMSPLAASFCKRNEQKFKNMSLRFLLKHKNCHCYAWYYHFFINSFANFAVAAENLSTMHSSDTWERPDRKFTLTTKSMTRMRISNEGQKEKCCLYCFNLFDAACTTPRKEATPRINLRNRAKEFHYKSCHRYNVSNFQSFPLLFCL